MRLSRVKVGNKNYKVETEVAEELVRLDARIVSLRVDAELWRHCERSEEFPRVDKAFTGAHIYTYCGYIGRSPSEVVRAAIDTAKGKP